MFAAEYRSDNYSGLNCRVIKIQHQTERLCLNKNLIGLQPTALITTQNHNLVLCSLVRLSINQTRYFGTLCRVVLTESEHQTVQVRSSRHFIADTHSGAASGGAINNNWQKTRAEFQSIRYVT